MAGTLAAAAAGSARAGERRTAAKQEYYEWRQYRLKGAHKQKGVSAYLEKALVPALNRMGINRVGVFTLLEPGNDPSLFMLIPYPTLEHFTTENPKLAADEAYAKAAADQFALPKKDPPYGRIVSRFMKAFEGMPVIEMPAQTAGKQPRIFELRTYESHNAEKARLKVEMFNKGEIQVMRDVKMAPVFFGEMLIADDVPNLTYMLSAGDMEAHQAHWKAFLAHPEWKRMKKMARYKDTVSKITKWFLKPTAYSQV